MASYCSNGRPLETACRMCVATYSAQHHNRYTNRILHSLFLEVFSCSARASSASVFLQFVIR
ncbi:hypothetical protein, partial [Paraburkholderia tropica]|uniref:hypothetical protein n=1 Tax=Paraburkholderia tropica TaxID=92647 RepID=UPI002AB78CD2